MRSEGISHISLILLESDECEVKTREGESDVEISLFLPKSTKDADKLTYPSEGNIAIKSTYAFTSYAPWRYLRFKSGIFRTGTSD